jgi:phosphotransferase system HPr (HPr) family protein
MIRESVQILNTAGLHARTAAQLVKTASQFKSHIELECHTKTANAKDIIEIMMLGATQHSWVALLISGEDALENERALAAIKQLINDL